MNGAYEFEVEHRTVRVSTDAALLKGTLAVPNNTLRAVLFAHGSGSSRHSPRNRYVAQALHEARLATLLISVVDMNREALEQIRGKRGWRSYWGRRTSLRSRERWSVWRGWLLAGSSTT